MKNGPKKGDAYDLNNWIGINLLDVCSKILSAILNKRSQLLLKKLTSNVIWCRTKVRIHRSSVQFKNYFAVERSVQ